jgi:thiol-disulfide isomerase/thioredoxin
MKRRAFSTATTALIATAAWTANGVQAQVKKLEEGTDFLALPKPVQVEAPKGKIEVIEFFWYNCPHCNAFEPALEAWIKRLPKDIFFKRVPVAFDDSFVPQQRLFYVLEAMNKVDEMQAKVFKAIHTDKQDLKTLERSAPGSKNKASTRPSFWICTTPFRFPPRRAKRLKCRRPTRCRASQHWALLGASIPMVVWPAAWKKRCSSRST